MMETMVVAECLVREWPAHTKMLAQRGAARYQAVKQNRERLPVDERSPWVVLDRMTEPPGGVVEYLLGRLEVLEPDTSCIACHYVNSVEKDLLSRWTEALGSALAEKYAEDAEGFLERIDAHDSGEGLADALSILTHGPAWRIVSNAVTDALRTRPVEEIVAEMKRLEQPTVGHVKVLRMIYGFDLAAARQHLFGDGTSVE